MNKCVHAPIHIYIYVHAYIYIHIHTYLYTCVCNIYAYVDIYIYICMCTHIRNEHALHTLILHGCLFTKVYASWCGKARFATTGLTPTETAA